MTIQKVESLAKKYKRVSALKSDQVKQKLPSLETMRLALSSTSIGDVQRLKGVSGELENVWIDGQNLVSAHISLLQAMAENRRRSEQGTKSGLVTPRKRRP